jgi:aldose 1-epimerase
VLSLEHRDLERPERTLEARIAPEFGGNLFSLRLGGRELLRQPPRPADLAGFWYGLALLYPFPNRVRGARFGFDGGTFAFPPNDGTRLLHAFACELPFEASGPSVQDGGATATTWLDWSAAQPRFALFPRHRLTVTWRLGDDGLRCDFAVDNRDRARLPFGFGLHPWFNVLDRAQTFVTVAAQAHMQAHELLPTGALEPLEGSPYDLRRPRPLSELDLDDVYWGVRSGQPSGFEARDRGIAVSLTASPEFTHMAVYASPDRDAFCLENQTCSTDAHNLYARGLEQAAHLLIAEGGQTIGGWVRIAPRVLWDSMRPA